MLFPTLLGDQAPGNVVQLPAIADSTLSVSDVPSAGTVYSGLKIDADGNIYRRQLNGAWGFIEVWLQSGVNSTYYISSTVTDGSLTTDDASGGTVQLNADRIFDVQQTSEGTKAATVTLLIYDNATEITQNGFPIQQSYTFSAEMESP